MSDFEQPPQTPGEWAMYIIGSIIIILLVLLFGGVGPNSGP